MKRQYKKKIIECWDEFKEREIEQMRLIFAGEKPQEMIEALTQPLQAKQLVSVVSSHRSQKNNASKNCHKKIQSRKN